MNGVEDILAGIFLANGTRSNENAAVGFWLCFEAQKRGDLFDNRIADMMAEGEKLNAVPEGIGAGSLQFTAQHKRAIFASFDCSLLLLFYSNPSFGCSHFEWSGIPASTPPASATIRKKGCQPFFHFSLNINRYLNACQEKSFQVWLILIRPILFFFSAIRIFRFSYRTKRAKC